MWIEIGCIKHLSGKRAVTPCVGVWIEIGFGNKVTGVGKSVTPCVGVWIEITSFPRECPIKIVTPCVGVWIEIMGTKASALCYVVTPCVGVWIEINK